MNEAQLRLALSIISGRKQRTGMDDSDWNLLGYDVYKFGYYGTPNNDDIKERAEDIIFDALSSVLNMGVDNND